MTYGTRTDHYPATSKLLHWLVAVCVLTTAPVAIAMGRVGEGPPQNTLYNFHKSLGVLILLLMILRLTNRLVVGAPAPIRTSSLGRGPSSVVHRALYVLLIAMPVVGYIANPPLVRRRRSSDCSSCRRLSPRTRRSRPAVYLSPLGGLAPDRSGCDARRRGDYHRSSVVTAY